MRWHGFGSLVAAAVVAVAFGACGGGDDDPALEGAAPATTFADAAGTDADGGAFDACQLVTQADAERILGEAVVEQEPDASLPAVVSAECVWANVAEDHGAFLQFRVFEGAQFFQKEIFAAEEGFEEVGGLGDDAYTTSTGNNVTLNVLVGDQVVQLDASQGGGGFDPAQARAQLISLAEEVVGEVGGG